ncbi:pepsin-like aspartic protease [Tahibacter harae]|uniref:A1 family peptidase n=1 Tax=Tahibacter harae TaxID=2963937 RepID=A0ABT1QLF1_9GAMM|nr:pepsin-like aspartic protease [Tahibacter harae]MCQ4163354.1 A1 family peptidase [Tahibacter harae]
MPTSPRPLQLRTTLAYARGGYTAALEVGSSNACVNVLLDTGSSTLALTGSKYRPDSDSALGATALAQQVTYGKGAWAGPVLHSRIGFGEGDQARRVDGAAFALVENDASAFFRNADGILGLAYRQLNPAHDMTAPLTRQGRDPALTWPWPYDLSNAEALAAFKQELLQQPRVTLQPLFCALEGEGLFADRFALSVRRAVVHVTDAAATPAQLAADPLNSGVLVLGGGEECQALYRGGFQDVRILHDLYYNANLLSVQVGDQEPIAAAQVAPQYRDGCVSNAFIDTGSSFLALEGTLYDAVLTGFAAHDASLPQLIQRFEEQFRNEQGLPNEAVDTRRWPALHFRLEGSNGGEVCLRCEPAQYWQRNANVAGQSLFLLLRWSRQSVLGLPLLCGRYCIFDRRDDECGRVRLADLR